MYMYIQDLKRRSVHLDLSRITVYNALIKLKIFVFKNKMYLLKFYIYCNLVDRS